MVVGMGSSIATTMRPRCDSVFMGLARRALLGFAFYASVPAAVIVAGFLYEALGLWATILWGVIILAGLALYGRKRLSQSDAE
jgi:hypothetical protein